jgi:hypothetical protein
LRGTGSGLSSPIDWRVAIKSSMFFMGHLSCDSTAFLG